MRAGIIIADLLMLVPGILQGQPKPDDNRFEVVSIRPTGTTGAKPSMEFPGGGVRAASVTLKMLIQMAYDIRPEQLSGGAGWTDADEFTVIARGSEAPMEVTRQRLQTL